MKQTELKIFQKALTLPALRNHAMLDMWNHNSPHFGGNGPHRYDGKSKQCSYCLRPKNWKKQNLYCLELARDKEGAT